MPITITRKPFVDTFQEANDWGNHDELPVLPADTDPQLFASRNTTPDPFFLVLEKDSMIVLMAGEAEIRLKHPDLRRLRAGPGDFVYIPARTPHQVVPKGETLQYRFKALHAGREGVRWYCRACGEVLASDFWDTATTTCQREYARATRAFNERADWRTCVACGAEHPRVDLTGVRWEEIAAGLDAAAGEAA